MAAEEIQISIITVNLNNRAGLKKSIDSVIAQTNKRFEWIIIDGGSTDGSRELIETHADSVSYWSSAPDNGIYSGMNKGIRASHGEYLLFLNSGDALCNPNVISRVTPLLQGKDFYVGDIADSPVRLKIESEKDICSILTNSSLPHQAMFTRRAVFEKYGMFREDVMIASDWWLSYTALVLGNASIEKLPFAISTYDCHGISSVRGNLLANERDALLAELPRIKFLNKFYRDNIDITEALITSRLFFFVFRAYYYLYRKVSRH